MPDKTYRIVSRYLAPGEGWRTEVFATTTSFAQAGTEASRAARALDAIHGDSHFWTVDIYGQDGDVEDGLGSYYQLFHGRLS